VSACGPAGRPLLSFERFPRPGPERRRVDGPNWFDRTEPACIFTREARRAWPCPPPSVYDAHAPAVDRTPNRAGVRDRRRARRGGPVGSPAMGSPARPA
jgi:hypothetical protein